jgi:hypothetical protein
MISTLLETNRRYRTRWNCNIMLKFPGFYRIRRIFLDFSIVLYSKKHDVSKTGSVSVLR